jgi:hypothetical protein
VYRIFDEPSLTIVGRSLGPAFQPLRFPARSVVRTRKRYSEELVIGETVLLSVRLDND